MPVCVCSGTGWAGADPSTKTEGSSHGTYVSFAALAKRSFIPSIISKTKSSSSNSINSIINKLLPYKYAVNEFS